MRIVDENIVSSATDLATYMGCQHAVSLDKQVEMQQLGKPDWQNPVLDALIERGKIHEQQYLDYLKAQGQNGVLLTMESSTTDLLEAMQSGADYVYQARLSDDSWRGYADFLIKKDTPSQLGEWSYEVLDAKLARETRGETILQLCIYSELLAQLQGLIPEYAYVLTPGEFEPEDYRLVEYGAYYRLVKKDFEQYVLHAETANIYPEPVDKCDRCRWLGRCNQQRRKDDHLSFVAGIHRSQRDELGQHGVTTLKQLAELPLPISFKPGKGTKESLERIREQARLQLQHRESGKRVYEILPLEEGCGLFQLPEPSRGDVYFDIEGDAFVGDHGFEYLFGYVTVNIEDMTEYQSIKANSPEEEQQLFDQFMSQIMQILEVQPDMHIYHYHSYEPSALKRLAGRYAIHQDLLDTLLRTERFVDLHRVVKQTLRASVEKYSIKNLETFFGFERQVELSVAGDARHQLEGALELGHSLKDIPADQLQQVIDYNEDDCVATYKLRQWLEEIREEEIAKGNDITRPELREEEVSERLSEKLAKIRALAEALRSKLPVDEESYTAHDRALWLLSHLLEFYRREEKATWWEYFRLNELDEEERFDEKSSVSGLVFVETVDATATGIPTDRYSFPPQDLGIRPDDQLHDQEGKWGKVEDIDLRLRTIDVKKMRRTADSHPMSAFAHSYVSTDPLEASLLHLAQEVLNSCELDRVTADGKISYDNVALNLLASISPRLTNNENLQTIRSAHSDELTLSTSIICKLDHSILGIQGPPGTGKTYTGAHMILSLVKAQKKVGITGPSHKAIRNLLDETVKLAEESGVALKAIQKSNSDENPHPMIELGDNHTVLTRIEGDADIAAGTAWLFSREEMANKVDVLFIDEAGQFSLAHTCAVAQSADSLVLLGDPQQLDQPLQGTHPPGVEVSGLQHVLGGNSTMPPEKGLFLPESWRMHPDVCDYISEVFYEGKLTAQADTVNQGLVHDDFPEGTGLWFQSVAHANNQNSSAEEASAVEQLINKLLQGTWQTKDSIVKPITKEDILVVTPYNAQVSEISKRIQGIRVGTVDKFQGQEAPVVIVSYATSTPEDAPRGMDFLYSLNRLNVAVSRAKCAAFIIASPELMKPECKKPKQMKLANGLCRYLERSLSLV